MTVPQAVKEGGSGVEVKMFRCAGEVCASKHLYKLELTQLNEFADQMGKSYKFRTAKEGRWRVVF